MKRITIILATLFAVLSCKQVDNPKEQFAKWAQKGVVVERVTCKSDPSQTYCLYLPSNYDFNKVYPAIYAFDPHGNGRIPVVLMKGIAEELGYIVIGSNSSKNGLRQDELNHILSTLIIDSQQKVAIDSRRIYLAGFSGGARVACMLAQEVLGIRGVVACSAGFQPNAAPLGFHFIGVAGNRDVNYLEMRKLSAFLDSAKIPNQFIVFNGKHQWPNESALAEAIYTLEIYAMKDSLIPIKKAFVENYLSSSKRRIESLEGMNNIDSLVMALSLASRTYKTLEGLINLEEIKSTINEISGKSQVQQYINGQTMLEQYEDQMQKEFAKSFEGRSQDWWNSQIKLLTNQSSGIKGDVSKRLQGYISLSCYGYVNGALHYHNWETATYYISIYQQVDPENPDSWYALACLQANTNKASNAIESLKKAINYGFSDFSKIKADPLLINLRSLSEFGAITKE